MTHADTADWPPDRLPRRSARIVAGGRRGSVLVLVLGALALLSVVTLIYTTVGRMDSETGAVAVRRESVDATVEKVVDYIATDVIAADVLSTYVEYIDAGDPVLGRAAWDYPSTDWTLFSIHVNPALRFNPVGTYHLQAPAPDLRTPGDPWLASLLPTLLNPDVATPPDYFEGRDWAHISNIALDGRFVNLYNLRPNGAGGVQSFGFDATPQEMSEDSLWLLAPDGKTPTQQLDFGGTADWNAPAHWTARQRGAFRPAHDVVHGPGDVAYAPYQWADADGDGFYDSRWCELVSVGDAAEPFSILPRDGRFRWFIAARIIDLSGLVNINTAMDFRSSPLDPANPDNPIPVGLTPADIDARRLLSLDDHYERFGAGYDVLSTQGAAPNEDYSGYTRPLAFNIGRYGYNALRIGIADSIIPPPQDPLIKTLPQPTALERMDYYRSTGAHAGGGAYSGGPPSLEMGGMFGLQDALDLLAFHGLNDPDNTSRLERAVGGREDSGSNARFSPLRSNRTWKMERHRHDWEPGGVPDGIADPQAMALVNFDVRRLLTPLSGARPLRSTIIPPGFSALFRHALDPDELQVDAVAALAAAAPPAGSPLIPDPQYLFRGYADALLPHSGQVGAWSADVASPLRTLHFGHSAELALRTAAHMTANMIDAYDRDAPDGQERHQPRGYTLLIDEDFRNDPALASAASFPWWNDGDIAGPGPRLDLGPDRLAYFTQGDQVYARAVNVFGIEAQPFITQVASFIMYTDAPVSAGGDDEQPDDPITINGSTEPDPTNPNPDYLGQFVAFQITNPFDQTVRLSLPDAANDPPAVTGFADYYIEFGGRYFNLAAYDGATQQPVSLDPGETKVFYALSHPFEDLLARWQNIAPSPLITADDVNGFILNQLSMVFDPSVGPVMATRIARIDSTGVVQTAAADLMDAPSEEAMRTVRLWRVMRTSTETGVNDPANDLLADRMREPVDPLLPVPPVYDRRLPPAQNPVNGALVTTPGDPPDTGYSLVLWGMVKRRDDPTAPSTLALPVLGGMPAYCLEARWDSTALKNIPDSDPFDTSNLKQSDFSGSPAKTESDETFLGLIDKLTNPASTSIIIPALRQRPQEKDEDKLLGNLDVPPRQLSPPPPPGSPLGTEIRPVIHLNNDEFRQTFVVPPSPPQTISTLRVADLLLPLGIGPMHDPLAPTDGWVTLGEALALALHYSTPPQGDPEWGLYADLGKKGTGALDRAHPALDRFAPFEDNNADGVFTINSTDRRRTPGIPLALNVLNIFRTSEPQFGSLTRSTPGLINVNTAPPAVLRTIPMLAPTTMQDASPEWWGLPPTFPQVLFPLWDQMDVAAMLAAYRDKLVIHARNGDPLDYTDISPAMPNTPAFWDGRFQTTAIDALREAAGIASPGELLALVDADDTNPLVSPKNPHSIRHLGFESPANASGGPGVSSVRFTNPATLQPQINAVPDDFSEQLLVAAALNNTTTTRSDVFAAWFVLHGYQRSDTEGLLPTDMLSPSVARRYLMIVDRSNVTRRGQRPRILLLTEVPL